MEDIEGVLCEKIQDDIVAKAQEVFLRDFLQSAGKKPGPYIETIQKLPPDVSAKGVQWLQGIVDYYCQRISTVLSSSRLFKTL